MLLARRLLGTLMQARTSMRVRHVAPAREGHTMKHVAFASAMLLGAAICSAQGPASSRRPRPTCGAPQYPRVDAAGRVEIRITAPEAAKARVNFWSGPKVDMQKQADGTWTVVTPPLVPGLHYYTRGRGRRRVRRSGQPCLLRRRQARQCRGGSRVWCRLLRDHGCAARTGARGVVRLEADRGLAACARLPAARLRHRDAARGIRCCTCSTAAARTRPAGSGRAGRTSSSTT